MPEYTTNEAAALLGVTRRQVGNLVKRGTIHAQKHGRDWLIPEGEIERYKVERRDPGRPKGETTMTYIKCSTCGKLEEINKAYRDGWLIAQRKNASDGHLVIRCPDHSTAYAKRQAVK